MSHVIEQANWKVHWRLTESAGLMVYLADFKGRRVLWEASLPYVTVDHQRPEVDVEDLDAAVIGHGPFWIPLGHRTVAGGVRKNDFRGGFELAVDFNAGPYTYTQIWRFHEDGRFAPWLTIYGGGLHSAHTYHPHWRFDFDVDGAHDDALEYFDGSRWARADVEGWFPATTDGDVNRYAWRQIDFGSGAAVNIRPHHWEDAELFAVRYHEGEWPPFTPRSEPGGQPFPAAYAGAEPLDGQDVTLWYVSHVHFDEAFPFTAGPWIKVTGL